MIFLKLMQQQIFLTNKFDFTLKLIQLQNYKFKVIKQMRTLGLKLFKSTVKPSTFIKRTSSFSASNTFYYPNNFHKPFNTIKFNFSINHSHHHEDPIKIIRRNMNQIFNQAKNKYPTNPQDVIKQIYGKCQKLLTQNKRVEILIVYQLLSQFIQQKGLIQKYSSFLVISAHNSFLQAKYQQVVNRAQPVLNFEIKKHGENSKQIGDIYNMIGISMSKIEGKAQEGIKMLTKAFQIRKNVFGQSMQASQVLFNMGIINEDSFKMLQKAQLNYLDSIQMLQNCNIQDPLLYTKVKMRLAQVQHKLHKNSQKYTNDLLRLQELILKYKTQKKFNQHMLNSVNVLLTLLQKNLATHFLSIKQFGKCIKYSELCLSYLRQNKMENQDRVKLLQTAAIAYLNTSQKQKAIKLFEQSSQIIQKGFSTDEYKFFIWRFIVQLYRQMGNFDKQLQMLKKITLLVKNTSQNFVKPHYFAQIQTQILFCFTKLHKFKQLIQNGNKFLESLQQQKTKLSQEMYLHFKSHVLSYLGFAYSSTEYNQFDRALNLLIESVDINSKLQVNLLRIQFKQKVLKRIGLIYFQSKNDLVNAFKYFNQYKQVVINHPTKSTNMKINELLILLLNCPISSPAPQKQIPFNKKLQQGKYVQNINGLLSSIVKLLNKISNQKQFQQVLRNNIMILDPIYQMIEAFKQLKYYDNIQSLVEQTKRILTEAIALYEKVYCQEFQQVKQNSFKGDQLFGKLIKRTLQIKLKI